MERYLENIRAGLSAVVLVVLILTALGWLFGNEKSVFSGNAAPYSLFALSALFVFLLSPASNRLLEWISRR